MKTTADDSVEPLYGKTYLPRKFKTAFALPEDNCTDIHANDLGFLAIVREGELAGYNVLVGGGLGTTPSAQKTFPFLAVPLCYVDRDDVSAHRRGGPQGLPRFRQSLRPQAGPAQVHHSRLGSARLPREGRGIPGPVLWLIPCPVTVREVDDHLGWHAQGDGKLFLGIPVENGRIRDADGYRLASGLRAFFEKFKTPARLTCQQSILLADIEPSLRGEVEAWLESYGIATVESISTVRRWSMACPALPTCGLAVTEAERALPDLLDQLERELDRLGLAEERFTVRMTGCPNGCARPYNSDIGLVGRSAHVREDGTPGPGTYTIFLGGRTLGDRLNVEFKDYVPYDRVVAELVPVLARFKEERLAGESFGDFCDRLGVRRAS